MLLKGSAFGACYSDPIMARTRDFVDETVLLVRGGDGGNGAASFRREKYRPKGGPDGGNGAAGGSVILVATPGVATLAELAQHPHQRAERGEHGRGSDQHGAAGADRAVAVPAGTIVRDADTGSILADLTEDGERFVAARGGRGGRGNGSFATARRKAPAFAERGEPGEERKLALELRLLADVGLVGLPNAGKSSLIAAISAAHPKIAPYPFTTLTPNLGVAEAGGSRFVVADVPGLVSGAAEGRGLGRAFLRHLERCRVICYVVDLADDPSAALGTLRAEIGAYDPAMGARPAIVAGNKIDLSDAATGVTAAQAAAAPASLFVVSALTGAGVDSLAGALGAAVERAREAEAANEEPVMLRIRPEADRVEVRRENLAYRVLSPPAERLVERFDLTNPDAVRYVQERLIALGIEAALARAGARAGDEVRIGARAFEFEPEDVE
jgi:GTP-binding protein